MATFLYRLGRFSYRSRKLVGLLWLAVLVAAGTGAATLSGATSDSFAIPGTESQEAFDLLEERFPEADLNSASARVVFQTPEGETFEDPDNRAIVGDVLDEIASGPQVARIDSPYDSGLISGDGTIALAEVTYTVDFYDVVDLDDEAREVLHSAAETGREAGITVELGGTVLEEEPEISNELIGLAVAAVVLLITFGSLVAAGMPLLTGITGVAIGVAAIAAGTGFLDLGTTTPILATMLGLAVGIDYALFIMSRYRHELAIRRDGAEAAGRALGTAGSAVVFAGLTVMIALSALSVVGIPILTEMGLAAALTVGVAVVIALTLLPALLGFAGRRVLSTRIPGLKVRDPEDDSRPTAGRRWAGFIVRRPVAVLAVAVVGLGVLALPIHDLRLGVPDEGTYPPETTQRQAYDLTAEGFGPGFNGPLLVVADMADAANPEQTAGELHATLSELDGVQTATPPQFNQAGDTAVMSVVPLTGPDHEDTENLVETTRREVGERAEQSGADLSVTGSTAVFIDFNKKMGDALLPYLSVVIGLSFILLMIVFRSIIVPLKATLGFLLTIGATFGALVAVFQWGWLTDVLGVQETGSVISLLPIFIIGVVFGLAMDYEVFLVTRMREEFVHGAQPGSFVTVGFQHGARVVAAAAIIMISVFGGFILGDVSDIVQIGFALAVAIALDAFVVRMTIVPAVLALVGSRAWWLPRWLDRILPNVDVEGERLSRYLQRENDHVPTTAR
ncbi:MMPL family transporter [Actinobacteria bacterium YIM 96077]|uniref:MMPL family transporter n=1 Tax=Phytoactinopolyspora halophila TaxID=1981511 RepID=A0A329QQU8_9ACTN|nr:MMPL family transporter [Phytoactinopolyspora halophila]AYY14195.1 MMPL family transporter [Actinobacteria bacterium YIM 96077]RAW14737.1 MMPL family transporter [Phytoactinopolyspora halophila]